MNKILIAHRGNIFGPQPDEENSPEYIQTALDCGFDVEIDVWNIDGKWFLGHDEPTYEINREYLQETSGLWIHCKDLVAFQKILEECPNTNFFYHTKENYALTNRGFIWAYPNMPAGNGYKTIAVLPEYMFTPIDNFAGICSDYVGGYKNDKTNTF
jgi:hypothetical protein